jgi:hypothetical protein
MEHIGAILAAVAAKLIAFVWLTATHRQRRVNHRLQDELAWHRDALHSAWSALDGASAVIAVGRSCDTQPESRPAAPQ